MRTLSFVIPCYGSEQTIEAVVDDIYTVMQEHSEYDYEIILVCDASPDQVYSKVCSMALKDHRIKGCEFTKNFGQHAALMAGLRMSMGNIVICLDDDGQTPPTEVYKLVEAIENGADVAYAKYVNKKHSRFRNWGSRLNSKMTEWMLDKPRELYLSSFFALRRFVTDEIIKYTNPYPYLMGLVLRTTCNIVNVEVIHREREIGTSGYSFRKLLALWINGFTAFSVKPLRMATFMGMLSAFCGFIYAIWTALNKLVNPNAPMGWTSTVIILLILGGLILFVLGMIGEYIGRMYIGMNCAPQYVVKNNTEEYSNNDN